MRVPGHERLEPRPYTIPDATKVYGPETRWMAHDGPLIEVQPSTFWEARCSCGWASKKERGCGAWEGPLMGRRWRAIRATRMHQRLEKEKIARMAEKSESEPGPAATQILVRGGLGTERRAGIAAGPNGEDS